MRSTLNQFQMSDKCDRCRLKKPGEGFRMSVFNTDWLCPTCQEIEESHPDFEKARSAETQQVINGNYNFKGIGLPNDWKKHEENYCSALQEKVG